MTEKSKNELISLEFSVRYQLAEYLGFVEEEVFSAKELRDLAGVKRFFVGTFLKIFATVMFLIKSYRIGKCFFIIDSSSITRRSKGGEGVVLWSDVKTVYKSKLGFFIELKSEGGMPVPLRVLTTEQINSLHLLAGNLLKNRT